MMHAEKICFGSACGVSLELSILVLAFEDLSVTNVDVY